MKGEKMKMFLMVVMFSIGCSAVDKLDIPIDATPEFVVNAACSELHAQKCIGEVMDLVGIHGATCAEDIKGAIDGTLTLNLPAAKSLPKTCRQYVSDISNYISEIQKAAQ